jgi:hypothetical protein
LFLAAIGTARAHDPYEIASVVYVQSNRIEVFIELEFSTGMILAGRRPSGEASAENQFEAALPQLRQFAGGLLEITAGHHVVLPLRTNVQLGVEDHLQSKVEYALTDYRPLRFVPRGLRSGEDSPYGISLTVLDMVNQKVLGQTTLFADSAPVDFPAAAPNPLAEPTLAVTKRNEPARASVTTNGPPRTVESTQPRSSRRLTVAVVVAGVVIFLVAWRWSQTRR